MFFGLMVSVHGHLVLMLWACGGIVYQGRSVWQRRPVHLMAARRQKREKKGLKSQRPFQRHAPNDLTSFH
jgi:hypothetical protein